MNEIQKLLNRILSLFAMGEVNKIDDSKKMQSIQATFLESETFDNIPRLQDYGFTSVPLPGAEAAAFFFGGRRDNGVILKIDDRRYRIKGLKGGEVAIYTDEGDSIILKRGNKIEVTTNEYLVNAKTKIQLKAPLLEVIAAETTSTGKITAQDDIESAQKLLSKVGVFAPGYNAYAAGGSVVANGDLEATGDVKDASGTIEEFRTVYRTHTHKENGVSGTPETNVPTQEI